MPARPYCRDALDRLFAQKRIFEWTAFLSFVETLPFVRPLTRRWRRSTYRHERDTRVFLQEHAPSDATSCASSSGKDRFSPVTSRTSRRASLATTAGTERHASGSCSTSLHLDGELAIVGRRGGQRLWDLAGRWYPDTETVRLREAERRLAEHSVRALGVRRERGRWLAHPDVGGEPVPDRVAVLSPIERLVHDRDRAEALRASVTGSEIHVPPRKRQSGYHVFPFLVGDALVGRVEPLVERRRGTMRVLGAWDDRSRLDEALEPLASFPGVELRLAGRATRRRRAPSSPS